MSDTGKWEIGYQDEKHKIKIEAKYRSNTLLEKRWKDFERDVTPNPYRHPRIRKLKDTSFHKGTYRYRKDPIRVVYYPEKSSKTIYPLEVATATDVSYKRRSSR